MIKKVALFYNDNKVIAKEIALKVEKIINSYREIDLLKGKIEGDVDLVISIGGDGTLLKTARIVSSFSIPVAHINVGTLGFLGYEAKDIDNYIRSLVEKGFEVEERIMLDAGIGNEEIPALNDIVIKNGDTARLIDLELLLEDKKVYSIKGDGLIISTPTGSTAYSLAAGGPIVTPDMVLMIITPLNPHTLSTRPVIVKDIPVKIKCPVAGEEIVLTVDGQVTSKLKPPIEIDINIYSKRLKLVRTNEGFFDLLSRKMGWG